MKRALCWSMVLALQVADAQVHAADVPSQIVDAGAMPRDVPLQAGAQLRVSPGGRIRVRGSVMLPVERGHGHVRGPQVELLQGKLEVQVASEPASAVLVTSPHGAMVTVWRGSVHVGANTDATGISVHQGAAQVGAVDRWTTLSSGAGAVVRRRERPDAKVTVPSAPVWDTLPDAFVVGDTTGTVQGTWTKTAGASSYLFQLAKDASFSSLVAAGETDGSRFTSSGLTGGMYWARVAAMGGDAVLGPWSEPKAVHLLHITLPPHALTTHDGAIVLPPRSAISLDQNDGVQWASTNYRGPREIPESEFVFGPAPRTIGLGNDLLRVVRIRGASGVVRQFTLVARAIRASIEVMPERPRWPDDHVQLVVRVHDPTGRFDASTESLRFSTHVGIDEVNLRWTKSGATWTADVPSRIPPGPWVIRVQVKDSTGAEIGASVIDVDGPTLGSSRERVAVRLLRR